MKSVSEEPKISPRDPTRRRMRKFSGGFRWSPPSWGEKKRGEQEPDREFELAIGAWPSVDGFRHFAFSDVAGGLARRAPPSVGGGIEDPLGGTPPPTHTWLKAVKGRISAGWAF